VGFFVVAIGLLKKQAYAYTSTDTMRVSVTPDVEYSVQITSAIPGVGYDFKTVALNSTTQSTVAITLTNNGTVYEYFGISISNTSGSWTATTVTPSTDTFRMSALLNNTSSPMPNDPNFTALSNNPPTNGNGNYGQTSRTSPTSGSNTQNLWLKLEMPFTLNNGGTGAQTMTLSVTGQGS
jgi:hypothetical protein